jgi:hypothetical protein
MTVATFETEEEALIWAWAILQADADEQPEVLGAETGRPVASAASRGARDDLARKVGFLPSPPAAPTRCGGFSACPATIWMDIILPVWDAGGASISVAPEICRAAMRVGQPLPSNLERGLAQVQSAGRGPGP